MKQKKFVLVFATILMADLLVIGLELPHYLRYFTKAAITVSLIAYLLGKTVVSKRLKFFLLAALIFSLAGDLFLVLPEEVGDYFIAGLFSFLLAHLMYIGAFFKIRHFRSMTAFFMMILLLFFAMLIFKFIGGNLGELQPYVLLYMVVLLLMVLTSAVRKVNVGLKSYCLVLLGALLFMLSDSLLALNKFYTEFTAADLLIMFSYGWAQFFIIYGANQQISPKAN